MTLCLCLVYYVFVPCACMLFRPLQLLNGDSAKWVPGCDFQQRNLLHVAAWIGEERLVHQLIKDAGSHLYDHDMCA